MIGAHHPVAENDTEKGKIKNGLVMTAEDEQAQEKESSHKHTACKQKVVCRVPVFFEDELVFVSEEDILVWSAPGMPEVGDLHDHDQGIGSTGWKYEGSCYPEGPGLFI